MLFNSYGFLGFFPVVCIFYYFIPIRFRYLFLLAASLFFYMCWNPKYVLLLLTSISITYLSGLLIEGTENIGRKKLFVWLSFLSNLGILFFFKYFNFAAASLSRALQLIHLQPLNLSFDVLLPVGISFYTFQALSYTVDVFRGEIRAERNYFRYALYVSFFPQLVAGPIERSKNLLSQINAPRKLDWERVQSGLIQMLYGYFQKVMISDNAAVIVDQVYDNFHSYGSVELVLATLLFAVQIYCDFGGYSNIAIGAARILGFDLMDNFNAPYLSMSVAEFWRRWHVSLSSWFRDYVYIPLGGNRKGRIRKYVNLIIVFFASGLWHGASWHFVAWGVINGFYQIAGEVLTPARSYFMKLLHIDPNSFSRKVRKTVLTFLLISFSWIFFRASGIHQAFEIIGRIWNDPDLWVLTDGSLFQLGLRSGQFHVLEASILVMGLVDLCKSRGIRLVSFLQKQECWFRWGICLLLLLWILIYGRYGAGFDESQFIYFQF